VIVVKQKGQICHGCMSFAKKFIVCEACRKKMCLRCAADDHFCIECHTVRNGSSHVDEYFAEKYNGIKAL